MGLIANRSDVTWTPIRNNDISWNFQKWLIRHDGQPYRRYTSRTKPEAIEDDIKELLNLCSNETQSNQTANEVSRPQPAPQQLSLQQPSLQQPAPQQPSPLQPSLQQSLPQQLLPIQPLIKQPSPQQPASKIQKKSLQPATDAHNENIKQIKKKTSIFSGLF